jgi:hypothetical protein
VNDTIWCICKQIPQKINNQENGQQKSWKKTCQVKTTKWLHDLKQQSNQSSIIGFTQRLRDSNIVLQISSNVGLGNGQWNSTPLVVKLLILLSVFSVFQEAGCCPAPMFWSTQNWCLVSPISNWCIRKISKQNPYSRRQPLPLLCPSSSKTTHSQPQLDQHYEQSMVIVITSSWTQPNKGPIKAAGYSNLLSWEIHWSEDNWCHNYWVWHLTFLEQQDLTLYWYFQAFRYILIILKAFGHFICIEIPLLQLHLSQVYPWILQLFFKFFTGLFMI